MTLRSDSSNQYKIKNSQVTCIFAEKAFFSFVFFPDDKMLTPKFDHTTLKLSEEGEINILVNGIISINILNGSKNFALKVNLSYAIA